MLKEQLCPRLMAASEAQAGPLWLHLADQLARYCTPALHVTCMADRAAHAIYPGTLLLPEQWVPVEPPESMLLLHHHLLVQSCTQAELDLRWAVRV